MPNCAADLAAIGVRGAIEAEALARARRLFASAIETPGGLKIQTIHSFCAALLRQFPLEAGVNPGFREMDEREAGLIRREVFDRMAEGPEAEVLAAFARICTADELDSCSRRSPAMPPPLARSPEMRRFWRWFGLKPGEDRAAIAAAALDAPTGAAVAEIAEALAQGPRPSAARRRPCARCPATAARRNSRRFAIWC